MPPEQEVARSSRAGPIHSVRRAHSFRRAFTRSMTCTAQRSPLTGGIRLLSPMVTLLIMVSGCSGATGDADPPELTPALMASLVTGAAAVDLDASGHFQLKGPTGPGPRQLSKQEAEALAAIWPIEFGSWIQPALEKEHGGPIIFSDLRRCGRTLYATSPFEPIDLAANEPSAAPAQRAFGPWWLVTLCNASGAPELSLGVSAYATDLTNKGWTHRASGDRRGVVHPGRDSGRF